VFGKEATDTPAIDLRELHAKIGQLTFQKVFLVGALNKAGLLSAGKRGTRLRSDD